MSNSITSSADLPPLDPSYEPIFNVGFNAYVGPIYRKLSDNPNASHRYIFDVRQEHLNSSGFTHGGLLMSVVDAVLGATVAHKVGHMCTTISLNCDFVSAASAGERIQGQAQITRQTRSVVFVQGRLHVDERTLMTASGIWKVLSRGVSA